MVSAEDEDLLQHLAACHDFIDRGIRAGGVLVHWYFLFYFWVARPLTAFHMPHVRVCVRVCVCAV